MSHESRRLAGILLVIFPTVIYGGVTLLRLLIDQQSGYIQNPLRQDLWRAGHAHAGVLLILSLVVLRYVDEATLSDRLKGFVRHATPAAAILLPLAYFLSVLSPTATEPTICPLGVVPLTGSLCGAESGSVLTGQPGTGVPSGRSASTWPSEVASIASSSPRPSRSKSVGEPSPEAPR